ncbi:MAG: leucine-rich repeat protein [Clostridia bacterium]|nr:leucine-rich repeat protein [Clostridia bacterium]
MKKLKKLFLGALILTLAAMLLALTAFATEEETAIVVDLRETALADATFTRPDDTTVINVYLNIGTDVTEYTADALSAKFGKYTNYYVYPTSSGATAVRELIASDSTVTMTYYPVDMYSELTRSGKEPTSGYEYSWTFDEATGTLTVTANSKKVHMTNSVSALYNWKVIWRDAIVRINLAGYTNDGKTLYFNYNTPETLFEKLPNLEVVRMSQYYNKWINRQTSGMFNNCPKLHTVYIGSTTIDNVPIGVVDLSGVKEIPLSSSYSNVNATPTRLFLNCSSIEKVILPADVNYLGQTLGKQMFEGCTSLKFVSIPDSITTIESTAFTGCSGVVIGVKSTDQYEFVVSKGYTAAYDLYLGTLDAVSVTSDIENASVYISETAEYTVSELKAKFGENVTYVVHPTSPMATALREDGTASFTYYSWLSREGAEGDLYTWSFSEVTNTLTVSTKNGKSFTMNKNDGITALYDWKCIWSDAIVKIDVQGAPLYSKMTVHYSMPGTLFSDLPNLEIVRFSKYISQWEVRVTGMFKNCPKLHTIDFDVDLADVELGVIDLEGIDILTSYSGAFLNSTFRGCSSIKEIRLPQNVDNFTKIGSGMFAGCTSLEEIVIPASFTAITSGAFEGCSALQSVTLNSDISVTGKTFEGISPLLISCPTVDIADKINSNLEEGGVDLGAVFAFCGRGMTVTGYSVRNSVRTDESGKVVVKNGLRTIYSFNEEILDESSEYILVEYGSLIGSKANWNNYLQTFGGDNSLLKLSEGQFVSPSSIVKTPVYQNGNYVNNSDHENSSAVEFVVTVVNCEGKEQIKGELISAGYEVWKKGDNYFVLYTREEATGFDSVSLYKITLAMLADNFLPLKKADYPIWNTVYECREAVLTTDNSDITALLLSDPINEGMNIALYATDSTETEEFGSFGLTTEQKKNISAKLFGENVSCSSPVLDGYWEAHLDEKIAEIPEGKSFIAFTDFHFELDGTRNTRKATDMMKYVKDAAGIDTIINLGDTYTGEPTIEECEEIFKLSVGEYFYDVFGTDGLYAIGNHESNITTWRGLGKSEGEDGYYAYDYLVPDSTIYGATVANLYGKDNFYFDTSLIELAESGELVFSETEPYSEEQMKEEYIAWAKMHYYYDDVENGIRYIVYNSGGCGVTEHYTLGNALWNKIIPTQLDFIANSLMDVPSGYDVVFCGHMLGDTTDYSNTQENIFKILSAFKSGSVLNLTVTSENDNMLAVIGKTEKEYDFSNTYFNGTIFTIGGHWHRDLSYVYGTNSEGVYENNVPYTVGDEVSDDAIFWIGLNNDCLEPLQSGETYPIMERDTLTENCFNVITITPEGDIVVTRFGAGDDRYFDYPEKESYGLRFAADQCYVSNKEISAYPKTYEAVINLPETVTGRGGVIFGTYGTGSPNFSFEINENGVPRLYLTSEAGKATSILFKDVDVRSSELVHVAITIENFDAEALTADLNCYINGELKQTITGQANIWADFAVKELYLGGDARVGNEVYFKGSIKYAAAYADVRTADEIAADCASFGGGDPIFCYDLSSAISKKGIADISGGGYDLTYTKGVLFPENDALKPYAYSMAVVGDTQTVSIQKPENFHYIYDYILDNVEEKNIKFVMGLGDITDTDSAEEWELDMAQIKRMDDVVPYSLVRGNHDGIRNGNFDTYVSYNGEKTAFAGAYEEGSELNTYHIFSVGDIKYMVVCLDYGASDEVLTWAGGVIAEHGDHNVIVTTHAYLFNDGTTLDAGDICPPSNSGDEFNNGDEIWEKLIKNHENIVLVLSGHDPCQDIIVTKTAGDNENIVTQMLIDGQSVDYEYRNKGCLGLVTMFYFSEDGRTVQVEYYSTIQQKFYKMNNQFTFELDVVSAS